jgi:hypothetical protein
MKCNKQIFIWVYILLYVISFRKSECYKPTPLKMNLVPKIRTDQKRILEILLSTHLLFPR